MGMRQGGGGGGGGRRRRAAGAAPTAIPSGKLCNVIAMMSSISRRSRCDRRSFVSPGRVITPPPAAGRRFAGLAVRRPGLAGVLLGDAIVLSATTPL